MARRVGLTCSGHTRPVVDVAFSSLTPDGFFLISGCKGERVCARREEKKRNKKEKRKRRRGRGVGERLNKK